MPVALARQRCGGTRCSAARSARPGAAPRIWPPACSASAPAARSAIDQFQRADAGMVVCAAPGPARERPLLARRSRRSPRPAGAGRSAPAGRRRNAVARRGQPPGSPERSPLGSELAVRLPVRQGPVTAHGRTDGDGECCMCSRVVRPCGTSQAKGACQRWRRSDRRSRARRATALVRRLCSEASRCRPRTPSSNVAMTRYRHDIQDIDLRVNYLRGPNIWTYRPGARSLARPRRAGGLPFQHDARLQRAPDRLAAGADRAPLRRRRARRLPAAPAAKAPGPATSWSTW